MKLKVATHNVCHMGLNPIDRSELFPGNTYRNGYPEEILELMKREWAAAYAKLDADFVGLQEFFPWFDLKRTIPSDEQIFAPFGYEVEYGGRNLGFASRLPFRKLYQNTFEPVSLRQKEKFTVDAGGREITVINCHPSPRADLAAVRQQEYAVLIELFRQEKSFIALGDFNARTEAEYAIFREAGFEMANNGLVTEEHGLSNDNIIVSGDIKIVNVETCDKEFVLSDHAILAAELEL